ncbi:hypothetical protein ACG2F4_10380 [Halalkalibaculum sp. DA3122]|uniref:hypothetical protein n=1 Tax=unclassified Halalkalibaculum TaxID=2964617 RepID=UPI003753F6AE
MKNILKLDNKDFRGYWVRIQRDHRRFSKRFRRRDYDSWEEARQAAIEYRDEWLREWNEIARNPDQKIQYQNSVTGEIGIHKTTKRGVVYLGISYINEEGEQKIKSFRAGIPDEDNYEENYEKAMEKAKEFRDKVNMKRFGVRWVNYKRRKQKMKENS